MEMNEQKEKWIDEVMQSLDGMQRAEPPSGLFKAIKDQTTPKIVYLSPVKVWLAAASFALLLLLNLGMVQKSLRSTQKPREETVKNLVMEYQLDAFVMTNY